jgi:hypothetical protein
MPVPHSVRRWLRLPGRTALILGLGALSTAGAQAKTPDQDHRMASGDLLIRSEGAKIYFSEEGKEFQELQLRDTAEARYLRQLIEQNGAAAGPAGLRLCPTILAGGGGTGFFWNPLAKTDTHAPHKADAEEKATTPEKTGIPQKTDTPPADKKE